MTATRFKFKNKAMTWIISVIPGAFLLIFGFLFLCNYYSLVLIAWIILTTFILFFLRKTKAFRRSIFVVFFISLITITILSFFKYVVADFCFRPAYRQQTRIKLIEIDKTLKLFSAECGRLPTTEEGLILLTTKPTDCPSWDPIRMENIKDAWGRSFIYKHISEDNSLIQSFGKDGVPGGPEDDADISSSDL